MLVDFHLHSLASDGSHSPEVVIQLAKENGIQAISLTDHDTLLGNTEAQKMAQKLNMHYITGVELQADIQNGHYEHILAYDIKDFSKMTLFLEKLRHERIEIVSENIKHLQKLGYSITLENVDNLTPGRHLTVGHIKKWIKINLPLNSPQPELKEFFHYYEEIINLIKDCNGIAVWAHPFRYNPNFNTDYESMDKFAKKLVQAGLDGIEAYYGTHTKKQIKLCEDIAQKYRLIKTGGSDWHGWADESHMGIKMDKDDVNELLKFNKRPL